MSLLEVVGISIGVLSPLLVVALLALREHFRQTFIPRSEFDGLVKRWDLALEQHEAKIERNIGLFTLADDRIGAVESQLQVLTERQSQQWERIGQQMNATANTMKEVMDDLKQLAKNQQEFALRAERERRAG